MEDDQNARSDRPEILVDADACPVKAEVVKLAERHGLTVRLVSNGGGFGRPHPLVHPVVVPADPDAADDWIVAHLRPYDVVITADIPLAGRCLQNGALVVGPTGRPFTAANIGMGLAMRGLMSHLRETGEMRGAGKAFAAKDRSRFLGALEQAVQAALRGRSLAQE